MTGCRRSIVAIVATGALACAGVVASTPAAALDDPVHFWSERTAGLSVGGTYRPVVGDFGGGGTALDDILWYAPGPGEDHLWFSDGDGSFTRTKPSMQISGTYVPLVGDFAGSGLDDIFWYGPGPAPDHLWTNAGGGAFTSMPMTVSGHYAPVVLDDDGSKDDIVWARAGGGAGYVWAFEGGGAYLSQPMTSPPGALPLTGHFDAGICADLFWYGPGTAPDALWSLNCAGGAGSVTPQAVDATYLPVVGDFTVGEDGLDDIFWYRSPAVSYLWASDGDGTWTSSGHVVPRVGWPLPAARFYGFVHVWSTTEQDLVFWDLPAGDFVAPLLNTAMGDGYVPLTGVFVGSRPDLFWYRPGPSPERLMYLSP